MKTGAERVYSISSPGRGFSWESEPAYPEESLPEPALSADVIIAGGGLSGLAAAVRCRERGFSVLVLEAGDIFNSSGPDIIGAVNSKLMLKNGITLDKAVFAREWDSFCGGRSREEFLWLFINRSGEALDWICSLCAENTDVTLYEDYYKGTDVSGCPGDHIFRQKNRKADTGSLSFGSPVRELLKNKLLNLGGILLSSRTVTGLLKDRLGAVCGVTARDENNVPLYFLANQAVVIATGDISGSEEWMTAFCSQTLSLPKASNEGKVHDGSGHRLAYQTGAGLQIPRWAWKLQNTAYTPLVLPFLHVNRIGKRFMNEDTWSQASAIRCLLQPGGNYVWTVLDVDWKSRLAAILPQCGFIEEPSLARDNALTRAEDALKAALGCGNAVMANSLSELAEKAELPFSELNKTIDRYNSLADSGCDTDFGKRPELLAPIRKPPFFAVKWGPKLSGIFGGIRTDTEMHVLRPDGAVIPGLYAIGSAASGLFHVDVPPLLVGAPDGQALTWAYVFAETLAAKEE